MTKKEIKNALQEEYIVALGIFADYIAKVDEDEQYDAVDELDNIAWKIAQKCDEEEKWLEIYSALLIAVE